MDYGTGAIFGCPAHDQRDLDFARKYDLPVIPVVLPPGCRSGRASPSADEAYVGPGNIYQFRFPRRPDHRRRQERKVAEHFAARTVDGRRRARSRSIIACATGAFRASAIGAARSR